MAYEKVALITGGGTGIGRAIALSLAGMNIAVGINYSRSYDEAAMTLRDIESLNGTGFLCQADVSRDLEVRIMIEQMIERFGRIDILVNNAGTTNFVDLRDLDGLTDEYWDRAFQVNAKGVFLTSRACAEQLKLNRGCIVNITSIAGMNGQGSSIAYCASKAAAISITKSLALALAPEVRVNAIAPGVVQTRWIEGKEDQVRRLGADTPLGRIATPKDIAEVAVQLIVSSQFVTGQTIIVDGGKMI